MHYRAIDAVQLRVMPNALLKLTALPFDSGVRFMWWTSNEEYLWLNSVPQRFSL